MPTFQEHLLDAFAYLKTYAAFLSVFTVTPIALLSAFWVIWKRQKLYADSVGTLSMSSKGLAALKPKDIALVLVGILFLVVYIFMLLYKEDFAASDNSQFTFYSLDGRSFGMPIWKEAGRFFPLALQEYNLIGVFSKSVLAYHSLSIVQLIATIACIFLLLDKGGLLQKVLTAIVVLLLPSFIISFVGLIYPERNIIFLLSLALVAIKFFSTNRKFMWFVVAVLSIHACLYYKETMFLFVGAMASTRILLSFITQNTYNSQASEAKIRKFRIKDYYLEIAMLALSAIFISLYVVAILPNIESGSVARADERVTSLQAVVAYMNSSRLLAVFTITFLAKVIYGLFVNRKSLDPFWDSTAIGALLYGLAYIKLGMVSPYYMAPVEFIACLYLSYLVSGLFVSALKTNRFSGIGLATLLLIVVLSQTVSQSADYLLVRKNMIEGKSQIYEFLIDSHVSYNSDEKNLFFESPESGFQLMEFSSFLNYKGLNVLYNERHRDREETAFLVKSRDQYEDDLCVAYGRPHKCFHAEEPQSGDLIVVLPETEMTQADLEAISNQASLVFRYQPELNSLERLMTYLGTSTDDPEWLNAYVFEK